MSNETCTIMMIPHGFKIKKKADIKTFMEECMVKGSEYVLVIRKDLAIIIEKDKDGNIRVMEKRWDLTNPFEPTLVVADTKNNCYGTTVEWYIWHYRKHINAKWFNDRD